MNPEDIVNSPSHYTSGQIECIDAIQSALTREEYRGYLKGNILKYIWRERLKNGSQDVEKSVWYSKELIQVINRISELDAVP